MMASSTPPLSIIAAVACNNVIGVNNHLPWKIDEEMEHFTKTTFGQIVIMGRKTFTSLTKPLSGRVNIVLSRTLESTPSHPDVFIARSFDEAFNLSLQFTNKQIFVIGGEQLFQQAILFATTMIISHIHAEVLGDTFFPPYSLCEWTTTSITSYSLEKHSFTIVIYKRIP